MVSRVRVEDVVGSRGSGGGTFREEDGPTLAAGDAECAIQPWRGTASDSSASSSETYRINYRIVIFDPKWIKPGESA